MLENYRNAVNEPAGYIASRCQNHAFAAFLLLLNWHCLAQRGLNRSYVSCRKIEREEK